MLRVQHIREHETEIIERLKKRNEDFTKAIHEVIALDDERKHTQKELDDLLADMNSISKEIGMLYKSGKGEEANALKEKTVAIKEKSHILKERLHRLEGEIKEKLYHIPNVPNETVPAGNTDEDNELVSQHGDIPELHEGALPHWELADKFDLIDFDLGSKITGAGFPVYKGKGARLQRALINFFLDEASAAGYDEVIPPYLVNEASGYGTGQLPDKEGQMYHTELDHLYLIPTAEVPVTNIFRDEILKESDLPIKKTAYTPCFRREAGSYGKDVRGLNRLHQFDKVEIVQIAHPDQSYTILDQMVKHVQGLLEKLELPYRILRLCGGDLGFTSALTFDMEVYSTAQKRWLEVSSISNFGELPGKQIEM